MPGLGTLINVLGIIFGGLIGLTGKRFIKESFQDTLMKAIGLCVMFIGISGALEKMFLISDGRLSTQGTMVVIGSFTIGSLIGEAFKIDQRLETFGTWLKEKSGSSDDASFVNGFVTASFTVCIGAMAIVGSLQDGMLGDISTLTTKAVLDFLIIMIMTTSLGKGCIFSAIPVGILQWSVTFLASSLEPLMTELALNYISMTGSMLIFCVGVNLIWEGKFKVANMLPTVVVAVIFGLFGI